MPQVANLPVLLSMRRRHLRKSLGRYEGSSPVLRQLRLRHYVHYVLRSLRSPYDASTGDGKDTIVVSNIFVTVSITWYFR